MAFAKQSVLEITLSSWEFVLNCTVNIDLAGNYTNGVLQTGIQMMPKTERRRIDLIVRLQLTLQTTNFHLMQINKIKTINASSKWRVNPLVGVEYVILSPTRFIL